MNWTEDLWIAYEAVSKGPRHPFYTLCELYYADHLGRPSIAPWVCFRMLMMGFFEKISSERGIVWRAADSKTIKILEKKGASEGQQTPSVCHEP